MNSKKNRKEKENDCWNASRVRVAQVYLFEKLEPTPPPKKKEKEKEKRKAQRTWPEHFIIN